MHLPVRAGRVEEQPEPDSAAKAEVGRDVSCSGTAGVDSFGDHVAITAIQSPGDQPAKQPPRVAQLTSKSL